MRLLSVQGITKASNTKIGDPIYTLNKIVNNT